MRTAPHAVLQAATLAAMIALAGATAQAGGYLRVDPITGEPFRWDPTRPITVNFDLGPFGKLSKPEADALVERVMARWSSTAIPGTSVVFERGPDLTEDHGDGVSNNPALNLALEPDSLTPIIYDQTGLILSQLLGAGQERLVVGLSGSVVTQGTTILEGRLLMNGLFFDGDPPPPPGQLPSPRDFTLAEIEGVFLHEFGHLLNLDHASLAAARTLTLINGSFINTRASTVGLPTMFPLVFPGIDQLSYDDRAWIAQLYPAAGTPPTRDIAGVALGPNGNPIAGLNVVARDPSDPTRWVSSVSGYRDGQTLTGTFLLPGLDPAANWIIHHEEIPTRFSGLSRVGLTDPPARFPSPGEYLNYPESESNTDDILLSSTLESTALDHYSNTGMTFRLNDPIAPLVLNEVDNPEASDFRSNAMRITDIFPGQKLVINGNLNPAEGGNVAFYPGDPVEDWYRIVPAAGVEITRVTLTPAPNDDADLFLVSLERRPTGQLNAHIVDSSSLIGAGRVEQIEPHVSSRTFGLGTIYEGEVFIGITTITGNPGGNYTLEVETNIALDDAVTVTSVLRSSPDRLRVAVRGLRLAEGELPVVRFSAPELQPLQITPAGPGLFDVRIRTGSAIPDPVFVTVRHPERTINYGGQLRAVLGIDGPVGDPVVESLLGFIPTAPLFDANRDNVVDSADIITNFNSNSEME